MQLLKQPNAWSCGPTALAMVLDKSVDEIIQKIGHDGSIIVFPNEPEPVCHRGFHIQELLDCTIAFGKVLVEIQARPVTLTTRNPEGFEIFEDRWDSRLRGYLIGNRGLIIGRQNTAQVHAFAWDGDRVRDPDNPVRFLSLVDIEIESFLWLSGIKS